MSIDLQLRLRSELLQRAGELFGVDAVLLGTPADRYDFSIGDNYLYNDLGLLVY